MPFTAPDCQRRVRDSFAAQTFMSIIGANIVALEPGLCDLALDDDRCLKPTPKQGATP